jgi:hypothetical protein
METCSSSSSISRNFYLKKILKSQFLVEFQSFVFWQFWVVLGRNCCIDSGSELAQSVAEIFKTP